MLASEPIHHPPLLDAAPLQFADLLSWARPKCIPVVRELTFGVAEEITEEGLPLLLLFHQPDDKESRDRFQRIGRTYLADLARCAVWSRFTDTYSHTAPTVPSSHPTVLRVLFRDMKQTEKFAAYVESKGPFRVSCSVGAFSYMPLSVISRHRCHYIRATQSVMFCTLPQACDSTYSPASLSKPLKSGFSIGLAT
ncbi:unnamed protein product [Protopolystoma xenopodis]|uniref:Uncharacterized protein n=1 Tax=Protopolystoma xenopodis TaxID=117903 RepID=A0A3S5AD61_9PLAT|nr:unnamed protein product [Protopolystoma xenopodis]